MVQFLLKLLLEQRFLAVHHAFHWFWQTNFIPFMLRSRSRKFWKGWSRIFYLRLWLEHDLRRWPTTQQLQLNTEGFIANKTWCQRATVLLINSTKKKRDTDAYVVKPASWLAFVSSKHFSMGDDFQKALESPFWLRGSTKIHAINVFSNFEKELDSWNPYLSREQFPSHVFLQSVSTFRWRRQAFATRIPDRTMAIGQLQNMPRAKLGAIGTAQPRDQDSPCQPSIHTGAPPDSTNHRPPSSSPTRCWPQVRSRSGARFCWRTATEGRLAAICWSTLAGCGLWEA